MKIAMRSEWSAGPVCCDWSAASSMLGKCHIRYNNNEFQHTTNTTQFRPLPLYFVYGRE